jgi:hypothetical protein
MPPAATRFQRGVGTAIITRVNDAGADPWPISAAST